MPQKRNNPEPPPTMTWTKAAPLLAICVVFDALRFLFNQFWFFGPALAAVYCNAQVGDVAVIGGLLSSGCVTGVAVAGYFGFLIFETFGVIMAIAVGLLGWLTVGIWLLTTNGRIFKENMGNTLWFAAGLFVSEIPFIGSAPALTGAMWRMYSVQIKKDKAALKQYEEQEAAAEAQERRRQAAEFAAARNAQIQEQEALDEEAALQAANDNEIPDEVREAA